MPNSMLKVHKGSPKFMLKKTLLLIDLHSHSYQKYLKHKWPITLQLKYLERCFFLLEIFLFHAHPC